MLAAFAQAQSGSLTIIAALVIPVLLVLVVGGFDYAMLVQQKSSLQSAADTAAVASAKGLSLADARRENVDHVAQAIVDGMVRANTLERVGTSAPLVATRVKAEPLEVEVSIRQPVRSSFGGRFGLSVNEITVRSVARVIGSPNICVLALHPDANGAISLEKNASVTGNNCAVFSNSTHTNAIKSKNSASLTASLICSAGGKDGGKGNFSPEPLTDCPTFEDPLSARPEPVVGGCLFPDRLDVTTNRTLEPGAYCGGVRMAGAIDVTLRPGVYVFKDGAFEVDGPVRLTGIDVGLFFTGAGASLRFGQQSSISLEAPRQGVMAGMLMFGSRSQPASTKFEILSDDARNLLGTIYLPRGEVYIDANQPIADRSAYTAIVSRMMTMLGGPTLVLNTSYDLTDVPVPEGIRGAGQPISLVK